MGWSEEPPHFAFAVALVLASPILNLNSFQGPSHKPTADTNANATKPTTPKHRNRKRSNPHSHRTRHRRIARLLLVALVALLLLALLPPLLSLSRYQRRIATSMSQVLGRPVHLDRVTLNLLPLPSFTLENLVIDEAPAFGAEPIIRANTVNARLRVASLWRRHFEFSRITFTDPSVNLVRTPDGRWNLESVLLQAAHIDTAPTGQRGASATPRFPYIEATGARVNLKLGPVKTPFSLTEADFALWLPEPRVWRMRIRAKPVRTDTSASDTGLLRLEATLNRAPAMAQLPLDLNATWTGAPLGEASRVLTAHDAGLRGSLALDAHLHGLLSAADLKLHLNLDTLHRADFIPDRSLTVDLDCRARATHLFRSLEDLRCAWPVPDSKPTTPATDLAARLTGSNAVVALTGAVPDILAPASAQIQIGTANLPASVLLTWLRVLTPRLPPTLTAPTGTLSATAEYTGAAIPTHNLSSRPKRNPGSPASELDSLGWRPESPASEPGSLRWRSESLFCCHSEPREESASLPRANVRHDPFCTSLAITTKHHLGQVTKPGSPASEPCSQGWSAVEGTASLSALLDPIHKPSSRPKRSAVEGPVLTDRTTKRPVIPTEAKRRGGTRFSTSNSQPHLDRHRHPHWPHPRRSLSPQPSPGLQPHRPHRRSFATPTT